MSTDGLPPAGTWPNSATVRSAFVHMESGTSWAGEAFDAWLEAERQAASNETAKAIKDEILVKAGRLSGSTYAEVYWSAADIAAAHIKDEP